MSGKDYYPPGMTKADWEHVDGVDVYCTCGHYEEDHEDKSDDGDGDKECVAKDCPCKKFEAIDPEEDTSCE